MSTGAPVPAMARRTPRHAPRSRTVASLGLILAVALLARLPALMASTERTIDPDAAHLLNVARCFERGQGFSNPGAWPAWMKPARLPMPETFKEPGYPFAIAALAPLAGGEFRAGLLLSMIAGLLLPLGTFALARNLGTDRTEATLAGLFVAANPLMIVMSAMVSVDSPFPALLTLAFALAAWMPGGRPGSRPFAVDVLMGVVTGLAFLVRGQALFAIPALALLLLLRMRPLRALGGIALAAGAASLTALPFLLRNMRLFGVPFYSDVGSFGIWPYVDHLTFSHGLERPPAPVWFAFHHLPQVLHHMAESAVKFLSSDLPRDIVGNPLWVLPLVIGLLLSLRDWRRFLPGWLFVGSTMAFIFALHWYSRYFVGTIPFWALFTALGAGWIARRLEHARVLGPIRAIHLLIATLIVSLAAQTAAARRELVQLVPLENEAARAMAPFLRARLAPDQAAMVLTTSSYAWFADRPTVHLVIADQARFEETLRRLKVRLAVLPTSQLDTFAARFPEHRLPRALVLHHRDPARNLTVFIVRDSTAR